MLRLLVLIGIPLVISAAAASPPEEDILRPNVPTEGRFFVQFDLGASINWLDGNPITRAFFRSEEEASIFRNALGSDPLVALSVGYTIGESFRLRLRGAFDTRSADNFGVVIDSCPTVDPRSVDILGYVPVDVDKRYSLMIRYITLGLTVEYLLERFFLYGGPSYGVPIKRHFEETDRLLDGESACVYFPHTPDTARAIAGSASGLDNVEPRLSVRLGAGYLLAMTPQLSLVPEVSLDLPFAGILKNEEPFAFRPIGGEGGRSRATTLNDQSLIRSLQATLGLRFTF